MARLKAIILAGGLGTRLREAVPDLPKCMAPVAGRPFLEHLVAHLVAGGVHHVVLAVGYRADAIVKHFGETWGGATLQYSREPSPLGTGGAIALAMRTIEEPYVLALNGDTYLDIDIGAFEAWYRAEPAPLAVVLKEVPDTARYGAVHLADGRIAGFDAKGRRGPGFINAGAYLLSRDLFAGFALATRFSFEADFLEAHCAALRPRAMVTDRYFIDIGIPADYALAQIALRGRGSPSVSTISSNST